jgi:hypothetical protein
MPMSTITYSSPAIVTVTSPKRSFVVTVSSGADNGRPSFFVP